MEKEKVTLRYSHVGNRWKWYESGNDDVYYCTNNDGEGVFRVNQIRNSRDQLTGTMQFTVHGLSEAYAKRKIRDFMNAWRYQK